MIWVYKRRSYDTHAQIKKKKKKDICFNCLYKSMFIYIYLFIINKKNLARKWMGLFHICFSE